MLRVTRTISIDESEIHFEFVRSTGPGGQNVNKVATAVQLRFNVMESQSLPERVRERLLQLGDRRISKSGVLIIIARRHRSQEQNRADAISRLIALVEKASRRPRVRRETRPTKASVERRLSRKKHQSDRKVARRRVVSDD